MSTRPKKKRVTVKHKHTFAEGADVLIERMKKFGEDWGARLADYENKLKAVAISTAKQISVMFANIQALANASAVHDASILAMDKIQIEVFGQLAQIDILLEHLTTKEQRDEWLKPDEIREKAAAWYHHLTKLAFEQVQKDREERKLLQQEAAKRLAEEAEKKHEAEAEEAKKNVVAEAIQQAESPQVVTPDAKGGGEGADIPEGAQVFGGG